MAADTDNFFAVLRERKHVRSSGCGLNSSISPKGLRFMLEGVTNMVENSSFGGANNGHRVCRPSPPRCHEFIREFTCELDREVALVRKGTIYIQCTETVLKLYLTCT